MKQGKSHTEPRRREDGLIVQELPDETLIYDLESDKAHCLNKAAAFVWKHCDGKTSPADIARRAGAEGNLEVTEDVVWLALDALERDNLMLASPTALPENVRDISRRQLMRRLGIAAAVSLPLITTIVAPTPAQAGSPPCNPGDPGCTSP